MKEVSASFLSNDDMMFNINKLNNSDTDYIHFDVMDNTFVNNCFINIDEINSLIKLCNKKIDIHLMVNDVLKYADILDSSKVSFLTIHFEIGNTKEIITKLKDKGFKVGLAINPDTDISCIIPYLKDIDLVLVMSVIPGKSGQTFIKSVVDKIDYLNKYRKSHNLDYKISVDGGVCEEVLPLIKDVDIVVSSSFILKDLNNIDIIKNVKL